MAFFRYEEANVYYSIRGTGEAVILLHGNTASSKMFRRIAGPLARVYRVILLDLPGHGKSDRLDRFPVDFWYENHLTVPALMEHLELAKASLIGSSGGALVALNVGLERPDLVDKIVADSFEGDRSVAWYANTLAEERSLAKKKMAHRLFWRSMHGPDWEQVVDRDTAAVTEHHRRIGAFFHRDIGTLTPPVLITGSLKDEFIPDIEHIYMDLERRLRRKKIVLFPKGKHPAMLSNKAGFLEVAKKFLFVGD